MSDMELSSLAKVYKSFVISDKKEAHSCFLISSQSSAASLAESLPLSSAVLYFSTKGIVTAYLLPRVIKAVA